MCAMCKCSQRHDARYAAGRRGGDYAVPPTPPTLNRHLSSVQQQHHARHFLAETLPPCSRAKLSIHVATAALALLVVHLVCGVVQRRVKCPIQEGTSCTTLASLPRRRQNTQRETKLSKHLLAQSHMYPQSGNRFSRQFQPGEIHARSCVRRPRSRQTSDFTCTHCSKKHFLP